MKVILLHDVPKVGRKYDIKDVPSGYARNFLILKKLAEVATPAREHELKTLHNKEEEARKTQDEAIASVLRKVDGKKVTIHGKASEAGHLFARVKAEDIAGAVEKELGVAVDSRAIILAHPIKEVGEHTVTVEAGNKKAKILLSVVKSE